MKVLGRYATATTLVVLIIVGALAPFLDARGRASLLVAAAVAVPVQWASFFLLVGAGSDHHRFLVRWAIGILTRLGVVAGVGILLPRLASLDGSVLILGVCGFFFVLLLFEPAFIRSGRDTPRFAQ